MNIKALIISHNSFSDVYNNGKTLEAIFEMFEKQNLAQLFFNASDAPDLKYCSNYFRITDTEVVKSIFNKKIVCGNIINKDLSINIKDKKKLYPAKLAQKLSQIPRRYPFLRDFIWNLGSWNSPNLNSWISSFNPDFVFFVGGNYGFSHNIALSLSKKINKPLVTFFTDDYYIYPLKRNILDYFQHMRMGKFYKQTIAHSSLLFTIGDLMTSEYESFFGKSFFSIMNSIEESPYCEYEKSNPIIISYFGGLHLDRWKMIVRLAKIIDKMEIRVYSVNIPDEFILKEFEIYGAKYMGSVLKDDLKNAIFGSDVLLHVESDNEYYKSLTRLSVSTKIPEYLISGRMILGFGPSEVASMKILSNNNIGFQLDSSMSDLELKNELQKIENDSFLRKKIGLRGYKYAIDKFNRKVNSQDFANKVLASLSFV